MIGLDTTAVIDLFKKDPSIIKLIEKTDEEIASTIITYQELMFGINFTNPVNSYEEKFYDNFFDRIFVLTLDNKSAKKSSEIYWDKRNKGANIGKSDCIISGILIANRVNKIITRNKKHFENIKGLKVINY